MIQMVNQKLANHRVSKSILIGLLVSAWAAPGFAQETDLPSKNSYLTVEPPRKTLDFLAKPAKATPSEQLAYAQGLADDGKTKSALKQMRYLVLKWPESSEAPVAQLHRAQLLQAHENWDEAFEAYQFLMNKYAGQFPYDDVLDAQFQIANTVENGRARIFGIPAARAPERAIPLYQAIIANAPQWASSADAQYRIGSINQGNLDFEEAILAFEAVMGNYAGSDFERLATFAKAQCLDRLSRENPNDEAAAQTAWAAYNLYLQKFPKTDDAEEAFKRRDAIRASLAEGQYKKALYYDETVKSARAARIAYEELLEEFPNSAWTEVAQQRIRQLSTETDGN